MTVEVLKYAAFTDGGHGGNPAGVVLDTDVLTDDQMLAIAEAIGFSETAFLSDDRRRLRFFSPQAEVAFCGHATIATAVALADRDGPGTHRLQTAAGPVTIETAAGATGVRAALTSPPATTRPADPDVVVEALAAFGWTQEELDPAYPTHVANAGNDHLVLGLRRLETLSRFDYDFDTLAGLMSDQGWTTVHAFVPVSPGVFRARNAFPPGGVREDPATGAAAAAFAGYLRGLGLVSPPDRFTVHQGVELGRPSVLEVELRPGDPRVRVSGAATRLGLSPYDDLDHL
jgi:PhzF family phenazine biosynthesis protein